MKQKTALILDGDPYAFKAAITNEGAFRFDDNVAVAFQDIDAAVASAAYEIDLLVKRFKADVVAFCWSGENRKYFRHDLGSYKAERKASVRPLCVKEIKEELAKKYRSEWRPNLEGDDVIGILMTDPEYLPGYRKIAISIDKDLKTIPGLYFNPDKMDDPVERSVEECEIFFLSQAIAGDITDGYSGAPGFGMKTAEALLREGVKLETYEHTLTRGARKGQIETRTRKIPAENAWETVVSCYESTGLDESDALLNARMARILTADLWDKEMLPHYGLWPHWHDRYMALCKLVWKYLDTD